MEHRKRKRIRIFMMCCFGCVIFLLLLFAYEVWMSYHLLKVNSYHFSEQIFSNQTEESIKLVVLSDLHDHEFGKQNQKLINRVAVQSPDLILLCGDILNEDSENAKVPCTLIAGLKNMAPVYFAFGNHEYGYQKSHPELTQELETAGAVVLDETYVDLDVRGREIRLGAMYDYAFAAEGNESMEGSQSEEKQYLEEFQDTNRFKIMMAHRPDSFVFGDASKRWDIDLVISGHDHGGQVVIPFLGGLYGGDQGWFPKYIHGMYKKDKMCIFVTSGLGSNRKRLPRFHNPPELAVVSID